MLDTLTLETFTPLQGDTFQLTGEGAAFDMTLNSARGNGLSGSRREQFSLYFLGPPEPIAPQAIYHLDHATLGGLDIFLVPVSRNADGVTYEAIFT